MSKGEKTVMSQIILNLIYKDSECRKKGKAERRSRGRWGVTAENEYLSFKTPVFKTSWNSLLLLQDNAFPLYF